MIHSVSCLEPDGMRSLLAGDLTPEELSAAEAHLTSCDACRQRIESEVGNQQWWSDVQESLSSDPGTASAIGAQTPELETSGLLELLGPTDDPEMLGRIGPYEIVGLLGQGGMGVVFKGFDRALNRFVAIKMLLPQLAASGAARKRFAREAQAAAAIVDDHVMAIHNVADWNGTPYFVMPYSRGVSLQRRLHDQGPLELREILRIGTQVAKGLAAAHAQGIVHRDVKPANIFLEDGVERVALMDFGLARAIDDASLTRTGILAGTPLYMAPEQARAETVDARSDLFSLGSVLYAMCTGHPPFRAETAYGVLRLITDRQPRPIPEINPDIPDWMCRLIARLMEKRPDDRISSADEAAGLLERCLAHVQDPTTCSLPPEIKVSLPRERPLRIQSKGVLTMFAVFSSLVLALVLWQSTEPSRNGSDEASQLPAERVHQFLQNDLLPQSRLPNALIERLGPLRERITIPKNAAIKDLEDRYEITASPWQTRTLLIDGDIPSRAHQEHAGNDSAHGTGHEPLADEADHTHKLSHAEYFADEGKLTVAKAKDGVITFELIGHAAFDGEFIHYSADRMLYHLGGSDDRMILLGHARLVNDQDKMQLTADKITSRGQTTLADGNVRLRRKNASGESETISGSRLEIDHSTGAVRSTVSRRGARKLTNEERREVIEWIKPEVEARKLTDEEQREVLKWLQRSSDAEEAAQNETNIPVHIARVREEESIVATRLEGTWQSDAELTKHLGGDAANARITFTNDPGARDRMPGWLVNLIKSEKKLLYMTGVAELLEWKHDFVLTDQNGVPVIIMFDKDTPDPATAPLADVLFVSPLEVMVVAAKNKDRDMLLLRGPTYFTHHYPLGVFRRTPSETRPPASASSSVRLLEIDLKSAESRLAEAKRNLAQAETLQPGAIPSAKVDELRFASRQAELDVQRQKILLEQALKSQGELTDQVRLLEIDRRAAQLRLDAAKKRFDTASSHVGLVPQSTLDERRQAVQQAELEVERIDLLLATAERNPRQHEKAPKE